MITVSENAWRIMGAVAFGISFVAAILGTEPVALRFAVVACYAQLCAIDAKLRG